MIELLKQPISLTICAAKQRKAPGRRAKLVPRRGQILVKAEIADSGKTEIQCHLLEPDPQLDPLRCRKPLVSLRFRVFAVWVVMLVRRVCEFQFCQKTTKNGLIKNEIRPF